jgi:hypothetical protein
VGAGGTVAAGGAVRAGGTVAAGGAVIAEGLATSGTESKESGQLESGASRIVEGSGRPSLMVDDGGQAGIVCSVGGSGGQTSVSSGTAPCAGATSS